MQYYSLTTSRRGFLKGAACTGALVACQAPTALCARVPQEAITETRLLLGTFVTLSVMAESADQAQGAINKAFARVTELEAVLTRHAQGSPLQILNSQGTLKDAPQELALVLARAQRFGQITGGAFDVTVAPVLNILKAWQNPRGNMRVDVSALAHARSLVHADGLTVEKSLLRLDREGMAVTLDGIAKGYIADAASETLAQYGVHHHLVNAGGDIRVSGQKGVGRPWMVGIENPAKKQRTTTLSEVIPITAAIATSGGYEIYYDAERTYHHLIEPRSGQSPTRVRSVSVTAPTAIQADALATAFSVMIPQDALRLAHSLPKVECCILEADGIRSTSQGWGRNVV